MTIVKNIVSGNISEMNSASRNDVATTSKEHDSPISNGSVSTSSISPKLIESPDLFDDSSPTQNISRYGRTRKQKTITDFLIGTSYENQKVFKTPRRSPKKLSVSPKKRTPEKTPIVDNNSKFAIVNGTASKSNPKSYVHKDLIQENSEKEETASIMRNMFSPSKGANANASTSPKSDHSSPLEKIILKKSPEGIFECSPKKNDMSKSDSNFDSQDENAVIIKAENLSTYDNLMDENEQMCGWIVGEMAWARVGGHPMWPCIITRDAENKYVKKKTLGRSLAPSFVIHVTFFADNGRHSWLFNNFLMRFDGLDEFNKIKFDITPEMRKKDPKYCASFDIKPNKKAKWQTAVSEAEMLLRRPPEVREDFLVNMFIPAPKTVYKQKKKVVPKVESDEDQNFSLSESLFDSLFVESNMTTEKENKIISSNQHNVSVLNNSLKSTDIKSEKNMSQSHMDRWLLKVKEPVPDEQNSSVANTSNCLNGDSNNLSDGTPNSIKKYGNNARSDSSKRKKKLRTKNKEITKDASTAKDSKSVEEIPLSSPKRTKSIDKVAPLLIIVNDKTSVESVEDCSENECDTNSESTPKLVKRKRKRRVEVKGEKKLLRLRRNISNGDVDNSDDHSSSNNSSSEANVVSKKSVKYDNPDFLQFLALKRDAFMDDNPELEECDIECYLYKVWQYEESQSIDEMKSSNSLCLVKGMADDILPPPPKKVRKQHVENEDSGLNILAMKERSNRKNSIKSYFPDDSGSSEDSDFELAIVKKSKESGIRSKEDSNNLATNVKTENGAVNEVYDCEKSKDIVKETVSEKYLKSLRATKPNIFKGLSKEKVCDICELPGNLVKCKGPCHGMFHTDCVQRQLDPNAFANKVLLTTRRKKKGKSRYTVKEKVLNNSINCNGDASDSSGNNDMSDPNSSIKHDNKLIVEPHLNGQVNIPPDSESIIGDVKSPLQIIESVAEFEMQMSQKMQELLDNQSPIDLDNSSISSVEDCDWSSMRAGECVIVDVKISKKKRDESPRASPEVETEVFKCNHCLKYDTPLCFVCKSDKQPKTNEVYRQRCNILHCHQFYHLDCLKAWPQTKYTAGSLSKGNKQSSVDTMYCPRHVCHTCVSDDPQGCKTRFSGDKLARCIKCPATYHCFTQCIPAGTSLITASQVICPRHNDFKLGKTPYHVNTSWCFICAKGGMLVCCETCPTSFHAECLNVPLPEGGYICEDCETGRLPLYDELVWVKLGQYRWWPALVLHPSDIPPNIDALPHLAGQFVVRFFGIYDHYWVNSGRVFPYQEGDTGNASSKKSSVDNAFLIAVKQAQETYNVIKELKQTNLSGNELSSSFLPPKYVKLKVNRAIGGAVIGSKCGAKGGPSKCECDPNSDNPCAPDTDCLNRMLLTECSPNVCAAGERCGNQAFEKRLYPTLEPSRTSCRGWGLKTLVDIKKGDFVIEYVGEVIDEAEFQRRMTRRQEVRDENYYFLTLDKDRMIDAGPKGNVARFMNHSCEPNCETQKWTVNGDTRVGLFALDDIPAGAEVTFNYNLACAGDDKKKCLCGTKRCAGYIGAKPKQEEVIPKRPKKPLKRKYRKKMNNVRIAGAGKVASNSTENSKKNEEMELVPEGIERDVAMINKAVSELEDTIEEPTSNTDYSVNMSKFNDNLKTVIDETEDSLNSFEEKKVKKINGKRKRLSLQLTNKSKSFSPSTELKVNKRTRSNSVQFSESVTIINGNDEVSYNGNSLKYENCRDDSPPAINQFSKRELSNKDEMLSKSKKGRLEVDDICVNSKS